LPKNQKLNRVLDKWYSQNKLKTVKQLLQEL
jgi:hypothetical protein